MNCPTLRRPLDLLARAVGVVPGAGCRCAVCGPSRYDAAGSTGRVLRPTFVDYDRLADHGAPDVCAGCARLMAGRPGDDPPPLRAVSVRATSSGELRVLDRGAWWNLLTGQDLLDPNGDVLSWAISRKRHHWLCAGISTPSRWCVGSDAGPIVWTVDAAVPAAVLSLRATGATKGAILSGHYPPGFLAAHLALVESAEDVLEDVRGDPVFDLIVWAAPTVDLVQGEEEACMLDPSDVKAAEMFGRLAWGSYLRVSEGKVFWGGYYLRRLRRFARLRLATCISRLVCECHVSPQCASECAQMLETMSDEEVAATESAIRDRTDLIHALAFARMAVKRAERSASKEAL